MKHQYNQGDILQFTYNDGDRDLLVITEVFEHLGGMRYAVRWLGEGTHRRWRCKINTLDDNLSVTLYARGQ